MGDYEVTTYDSASELETELSRIEAEYRRRDFCEPRLGERYSLFNEAALLHAQSLERHLLALLKQHNRTDLAATKVLDVGCGYGGTLRRFIEYGAEPANLSGIDMMPHRIARARGLTPAIDWQVGEAHQLPYPSGSFDIVLIFVVLSSILNAELQRNIATEVRRVCKPGGLVLCHDFIHSNPRNPAVQGITCRQIRQLFGRPGDRIVCRRMTLAPPIARLIAPRARWLADTLEQIRIVNTHTLCAIALD
jgi:ubiquinone/menaquinone biosynthesis C-methylase UbiE